jgi:hypothetical protein
MCQRKKQAAYNNHSDSCQGDCDDSVAYSGGSQTVSCECLPTVLSRPQPATEEYNDYIKYKYKR